jgi:hypothetical protein
VEVFSVVAFLSQPALPLFQPPEWALTVVTSVVKWGFKRGEGERGAWEGFNERCPCVKAQVRLMGVQFTGLFEARLTVECIEVHCRQ